MFDEELSSFLTKFHQLRRAGVTTHLDVDTCAGRAWVGLRVMLGPVQHPHNHPQNVPNVKRRSPSYYRRQERRKAARAAEQSSSSDEASHSGLQKDDTNQDKNAEEATFGCEICDFRSNTENGLNIHMSKKHARIEQIDGND